MPTVEEELANLVEGTDLGAKIEAFAVLCQDKLGIESQDVIGNFNTEVEHLGKILPDLEEQVRLRRAFVNIKAAYKSELRSPAKAFEGVILGMADPFDTVARARRDAAALYSKDPETAVKDGWTDADGVPLDRREVFPSSQRDNPDFGQPLPERALIQNVVGAVRNQEGDLMFTRLLLGDRHAGQLEVPLNVVTAFRANLPPTQPDDGTMRLNPSSKTQFEEIDGADNELNPRWLYEEWEGLSDIRIDLAGIPDFYEAHADDPQQRICVFAADVSYIADEASERTGSWMMALDDESLPDEHPGFTAFMPNHVKEQCVDFDQGSRIFAIGMIMKPNREPVGDQPPYIVNILGLWALPEFKIAPGEAPSRLLERDAKQVR